MTSQGQSTQMDLQDVRETATFAAGCFWGVEAAFRPLGGVVATAVGFMGGDLENPTYEAVCTGSTGHAEVVHLEFDPRIIPYTELLKVFWDCHDPTTLNQQGPDVGSQYRSAIFYHSQEQQDLAQASKQQLQASGSLGSRTIVTEITEASTFYRAEEYHQQYLEKRGRIHCRAD
ncbi:MAG: peptide-methionine (S)-S-oxide reductase MsrA [Acidobacteriota bacterium]